MKPARLPALLIAKPGKFELCNKGTILLDEIGEMPPLCKPSCCTSCRTSSSPAWAAGP